MSNEPDVIDRVRAEKLTYLSPTCLRDLFNGVEEIERAGRSGVIIETGAALGGSAIVMASAKSKSRRMKIYDAFGMIPAPSEKDGEDVHRRFTTIATGKSKGIGGDLYYGYRKDLLRDVTQAYARFGLPIESSNIELIKGLFADTLHVDEPIALAHLDGDWYESTKICLERIAPFLVPGGRLIIDDYFKWSGCRKAVDEYFHGREGYRREKHGRLHIVREGTT